MTRDPGSRPRVRRAISIGTTYLNRQLDDAKLNQSFDATQIAAIKAANAERGTIYQFDDDAHFVTYFRDPSKAKKPKIVVIDPTELDDAHRLASRLRFNTVYGPGAVQLPEHAPGAHAIPRQELPPAGPRHMWANTRDGAQQQFTLWQNKLSAPAHPTQIATFGDPTNPSIFTSQGQANMGFRLQPESNPHSITRNQSTYAGLPSETGYVRGHPNRLADTQASTDPAQPGVSFDNQPMLYTRESDGKTGGISSWRYNEIEKKAGDSGRAFNQVNVMANPQNLSAMNLPQTDTIHYSLSQGGGAYQQLLVDNHRDYRTGYDKATDGPYQKWMTTQMASASYPYEQVHQDDVEFVDADRHSYPGYASPPPTPFLTATQRTTADAVVFDGRKIEGELILYAGDAYTVTTASYNPVTKKTTCQLVKGFGTSNGAF